jgi:hypothetical protein
MIMLEAEGLTIVETASRLADAGSVAQNWCYKSIGVRPHDVQSFVTFYIF